MAYAAGQLPEAFSLIVAAHLSLCDDCRAQADSFDAVGGAVLEEAGEIAMGEDALARTLARIERLPRAAAQRPRRAAGIFPAPLVLNNDRKWRKSEVVRWAEDEQRIQSHAA